MAIPQTTQRAALEVVAESALEALKRARADGDELAADLAEHELNAALDTITARMGPGRHQETPPGRRAPSAAPRTAGT